MNAAFIVGVIPKFTLTPGSARGSGALGQPQADGLPASGTGDLTVILDGVHQHLRVCTELARPRGGAHVAANFHHIALDRIVDRRDVERPDVVAQRHEASGEMQAKEARST